MPESVRKPARILPALSTHVGAPIWVGNADKVSITPFKNDEGDCWIRLIIVATGEEFDKYERVDGATPCASTVHSCVAASKPLSPGVNGSMIP